MKDNQAKYPQLRFKGFTDPWEERKLGDEVLIVMGQSPNSENYTDNPNDHILVQGNADMKNGHVLPRVWTTQVTKQAEKNDLILSVRAPVGDIGKTAYDVVIGRGVAAIKGNEFIFQNLGKMKSDGYWTRYSTGSTFESINSTDIKEAIISIPTIEEQQKIGIFFNKLDDNISLHQRKLDKLKELKQGYLQKMFPQNGSKFPQLRFAGFADAWEQRKLGELGNVTTGKAFSSNEFDQKGEYLVITNKDISDSSRSQNVLPDRINVSDEKLINKYNLSGNNILVTMDGVNLGKTAKFSNDKALLAQRVGRIQSNQLEFIYQVTASPEFLLTMRTLSVGNAIKHISLQQISNYTSFVPNSKAEQQKIGSFFKQLDSTIALHQRKLEKLQELKKGYLQKMFC